MEENYLIFRKNLKLENLYFIFLKNYTLNKIKYINSVYFIIITNVI